MRFTDKLSTGQRVYGTCVTAFNPLWPKVWEGVGLDFVFIDTEHIALDRSQVSQLCQVLRASGVFPIVRIPQPDPFLACQMIDAGAGGIVAPYLESVDEIRDLVGATKYRPLKGARLARILRGEESVAPSLLDYLNQYNRNQFCIANIESVPALERLEELLSVEGLDAVFIGPHDLSVSMDLPEQYDHPLFVKAVDAIVQACKHRGLHVGVHFSESPERQIQWVKRGVDLIIHSSDFALFYQRLQADVQYLKQHSGDTATDGSGPSAI
ncbi:MAG: aldolase [Lunatimonas sp.]|uniref:HpcH/HpaI aldolase family protein n=1 Tax=Lunatimonas sp. TaxID=2060141 RepID=UPI00263ABF19|nr:aldolase/citrate lyase family protein [Lunatimonas sp.]MCC5936127.1 aldolase [Lunatimonas sp.]